MALLAALTAFAGLTIGSNAQCTPLSVAAAEAGLTSLAGAIGLVQVMPGSEEIVAALEATEETEEKVTVFAPNNAAFEALAESTALLPDDILDVLLNHMVEGEVTEAAVADAIDAAAPAPAALETLLETVLEASVVGEDVIITPAGTQTMAKLADTDIKTCSGIVHVVDQVLVPAPTGMPASAPAAVPPAATDVPVTTAVPTPVDEAPPATPAAGAEAGDADAVVVTDKDASAANTMSAVTGGVALLSAALLLA